MTRTLSTITAAAFMATALTAVPAKANDDLIRLGIGIGAAIIGEAMRGQGRQQQAQPQRRQQQTRQQPRQAPRQSQQTTRRAAQAATYAVLPDEGPIPMFRAEAVAAAEAAAMLDASSPITVDPMEALELPESLVMVDERGTFWGEVDRETGGKVMRAVKLGIPPSVALETLTDLPSPYVAPERTAAVSVSPELPVIEQEDEDTAAEAAADLPAVLDGLRLRDPSAAPQEAEPEAVAVIEEPAPEIPAEEPEAKPLALDIDL